MLSRKQKHIFLKFFSLFSVVRGYNILILIVAQYLASIYIIAHNKSIKQVLFDMNLLMLVWSSALTIAAGYIINNFYDSEKDLINKPIKSRLDRLVSQNTKLLFYFVLNLSAVIIASFVSLYAVTFFTVYIFGIWFYSHKLKRYPLTGLISATVLTILPFFVVFVYFGNFPKIIFVHAGFLFLVIMVRELIKDLENIKGALVSNYKTFPVAYGEKNTKLFSILLLALTLVPVIFLLNYPAITYMRYYFYIAMFVLVFIGIFLFKSTKTRHYTILHNVLKLLLLIGVFSLVFIDTSLLIEKVIEKII